MDTICNKNGLSRDKHEVNKFIHTNKNPLTENKTNVGRIIYYFNNEHTTNKFGFEPRSKLCMS
jgi:hypothetical protein